MRRISALFLALALALSLPACGKNEPEPMSTPTPFPTAEPSLTPTPEPGPLSEDGALLMAFVRGEVNGGVAEGFQDDSDGYYEHNWGAKDRLPISEILQMAYIDLSSEELAHFKPEASYVLMETMEGRDMLVVRLRHDFGAECIDTFFVFGVYGEVVDLTYVKDSWNRNHTDLYSDLIFFGVGSGGAGSHQVWCGYIGEDGLYHRVYDAQILDGPWVVDAAYEVFGLDREWANGCMCVLLTTDESQFYDLDLAENTDPEKAAILRQYLEEQGMTQTDDAWGLTEAAKDKHNIEGLPILRAEDWYPEATPAAFENWLPLELDH